MRARADRGETVVLLHGIGKPRLDMVPMARGLRRRGYDVVNWAYPSRREPIAALAARLAAVIAAQSAARRVHLVTHSMGGIVARVCLSQGAPANLGRLVMIAPPNRGARLATLLGNLAPFRWYFGPAGQELRDGDDSFCAAAGVPPCEFGIIAGGTGRTRGINPLLAGDDDGTVELASVHLAGARDLVILPYLHPFIHMMPETVRLAAAFLETGAFPPSPRERGRGVQP
jgi:pimeloyl-ACP methyl ester carboxylesterase